MAPGLSVKTNIHMPDADDKERVGYGAVLLLALFILLVVLYKNPLLFFTDNNGEQAGALKAASSEGAGEGAAIGLDGTLSSMPGMPGMPGDPIDLNSADLRELATLPGIGARLAERIVEKRTELGGFENVENLLEVKGIGDKKLRAIRGRVKVGR